MNADSAPSEARLLWPLAAELGEGPLWHAGEQALWFVDIEGRRLHRFDPASGERRSLPLPGRPSFVVPLQPAGLLVGMERSLHRVEHGIAGAALATVDGGIHCRTNDATVDARGRLWFGTLDLREREPGGQVYLFDGRGLRSVGGRCAITNGPAISADGRRLYHVDTLAGEIHEFDISAREQLRDGRLFVAIAAADGKPDGICIDAEGCIWVALWGGWCVRRYSAQGQLLQQLPIPCAQVTKVAFGGEGLRTAFVTTARRGLSTEALRAQPLAGALFAFDAPAPGLPAHAVTLR